MVNSTHDTDVAIIGGGPVGLTLALALAKRDFTTTVFDAVTPQRFRHPEFDGRAYAISLASRRLLAEIGVWERVVARAQRIEDILVTDGRVSEGASSLFLQFRRGEIDMDGFGHMLEDRWLRNALWDCVEAEPNISLHAPAEVMASEALPGRVVVRTQSGTNVTAQVMAACDGRFSPTAQRMGITRTGWKYPQTAIVCAVEHAKPHHGVAHEYFLPAGPFAILPLPENRSSIVWTEDARAARYLQDAGPRVFNVELRRRFGGFLGELEILGKRWFYGLELSLADQYVVDRMALVGDSAHRIHPIAGQGLNVGFADVTSFVETLHEARRRGEDVGAAEVLVRYQEQRRFDATALAFATDFLDRLYSTDSLVLRTARDLGMATVGRIGPLRRLFTRRAAGLAS